MQIYLVGGAVRDALMGLPVVDRDWVVVGSTPAEMVALGFKPVGRDFPVFLHPVTHEEYALARTERKTAPGYRGFVVHAAPDVTLEQDLARRDLTINSIAAYAQFARPAAPNGIETCPFKLETALLIDPFGGQADILGKVLRHVTAAFREDPVRILRVARFNARFPDFSVAPETMDLMRQMVQSGETETLVPERVWQELSKGLMATWPSKMMGVLARTGTLQRVLPSLRNEAEQAFTAVDAAAESGASLTVRFTCLMGHFEADAAFLRRVPRPCSDLATLWAREHVAVAAIVQGAPDARKWVGLFERGYAFRKPERFQELLACCTLLQRLDTRRLENAFAVARSVTSRDATARLSPTSPTLPGNPGDSGLAGPQIAVAMQQARVGAVAQFMDSDRARV